MVYPFVSCLSPVQVKTLRGVQLVPCGHCPACENRVKSDLQLRILLESQKYKHSYFLTNTYDDEHLPLFTFAVSDESFYDDADLVSNHTYDSDGFARIDKDFPPLTSDGEFVSEPKVLPDKILCYSPLSRINSDSFSPWNTGHNFDGLFGKAIIGDSFVHIQKLLSDYHSYLNKAKASAFTNKYAAKVTSWYSQVDCPQNFVALLWYRDIQNFLKRLRKQLSKIDKNEKIRYYIIGEYGAKSLRPHWHLLLFTNSDIIASKFADTQFEIDVLATKDKRFYSNSIICSCWKFGYCTISKADGKVGGYVSNYVVGSSLLPKILSWLAPQKTYHSIGFGLPYSKNQCLEMLKKRDFTNFSKYDYVDQNDGNRVKSRPLWRSYYCQFFPTFTGFDLLPNDEVYRVLTILPKLKGYFFEEVISKLSKKVWLYIRLFSRFSASELINRFGEVTASYIRQIGTFFDWLDKPKLSTIERVLYASNKFLTLSSYFALSSRQYFDIYESFLTWRNRQCLAQHFINCSSSNDYRLTYYSIYGAPLSLGETLFDRYKYSVGFSYYKRDTEMLSFTRIKHKEIYEQIKNI